MCAFDDHSVRFFNHSSRRHSDTVGRAGGLIVCHVFSFLRRVLACGRLVFSAVLRGLVPLRLFCVMGANRAQQWRLRWFTRISGRKPPPRPCCGQVVRIQRLQIRKHGLWVDWIETTGSPDPGVEALITPCGPSSTPIPSNHTAGRVAVTLVGFPRATCCYLEVPGSEANFIGCSIASRRAACVCWWPRQHEHHALVAPRPRGWHRGPVTDDLAARGRAV